MEVTERPGRARKAAALARSKGLEVGFVPTLGALHRGHASLFRRARVECGLVVASVFLNPLQFDSPEDLAAYPRLPDQDRAVAEAAGCDVVLAPLERDVYPNGVPEITVDPGHLGGRLEGASRPGHFRGVLTVVAKLLAVVGPCRAYFGEKDAQQLELVRRMARDLDLPVQVVGCPTIREGDGLAVSSRNARLSAEERAAAPVLFEALSDAAVLSRRGERRGDVLRAEMARRVGAEPLARLDYAAVVDEATWEDVLEASGPSRALVAASFGSTRLIDNLALPGPWPPDVQNTGEPDGGG